MELELPFDEYPKSTIGSLKIGDITTVLSNNRNRSVYAMCPSEHWDEYCSELCTHGDDYDV